MKRVIVISYDGIEPNPRILATLVSLLQEYQVIQNPDVKPDTYCMDEKEIVQSIVAKAMNPDNISHVEDKYEHAVSIVCEPFMDRIKNKDYEAFTIELAEKMKKSFADPANTPFNAAVRVITEDGSEAHLSPSFMFNHGLDNRVIRIIRRTRDIVCQGHCTIIP